MDNNSLENNSEFISKRFESLVENSFDSFVILSSTGETKYASKSIKNILGYTADEVLNLNIMDFAHPDDLAEGQKAILKALENPGIPIQGHTSRVRHKNGHWVWVEAIVTNMLHDPTINGIVDNFRDVTERINTQKKVEEYSQRLLLATQGAKIGIWDQDIVSLKMFSNDTMFEIHGADKDTFDGTANYWLKFVHPDDIKRVKKAGIEAVTKDAVFDVEFRINKPDGSTGYMKSLAQVIKNENNEPIRMVGANWDITKQKESEALLRKMAAIKAKNEEMEELAYITSHDLKEPILTLKKYSQVLSVQYKETLGEDGKRLLNTIIESANRMDERINDLLDYSQLGKVTEIKNVNSQEIIHSVKASIASYIASNHAEIIHDKLPIEVKAQPAELTLIFKHLICNAIKFKNNTMHPLVHISGKQTKHGWEFQVADNGIGIHEKDFKKIFSIFQKLNKSSDYNGSGIGLTQVKKLVELHNGQIWVESTLGKGSTFFFTINTETF